MRYARAIFVSLILSIPPVFADGQPGAIKEVTEEDAAPSCFGYSLKFTNGSVTDNGDGTCSVALSAGSGDITSVGDVASGAAFDGTQGTTLTFNDAAGDQTLLYNSGGDLDFNFSDDVNINQTTPHLRFIDSTASEDDFEIYADASQVYLTNFTDAVELIRFDGSNNFHFRGGSVNYHWPTADGTNGQVLSTNASGTLSWATAAGSGDITSVGDVASGAAFDGTQGTTLTFNHAGGDATLDYDGTDFSFSKSLTVGSGSAATETISSVLSGATDPLITFGNNMVTLSHDLTISGDDLFMATNTDRLVLIADGTNFNPEALDLGIDTSGNYVSTIGDCTAAETATCFNGSDGTSLTFNDADGDKIFDYDTTLNDFEFQDDLRLEDASPDLVFRDTTDNVSYIIHVDTAAMHNLEIFRGTDTGTGFTQTVRLLTFDNSNIPYLPTIAGTGTQLVEVQSDGKLAGRTPAPRSYWFPCPALMVLEAADSIPPLAKDAGTALDQLTCSFDKDTDEGRTGVIVLPAALNVEGTITIKIYWYGLTLNTNAVIWDFRHNGGVAAGVDPDATLYPILSVSSTAAGTAGQLAVATITVVPKAINWAAGDLVYFVLERDANHASDTFGEDAQVIGINIDIPQ